MDCSKDSPTTLSSHPVYRVPLIPTTNTSNRERWCENLRLSLHSADAISPYYPSVVRRRREPRLLGLVPGAETEEEAQVHHLQTQR